MQRHKGIWHLYSVTSRIPQLQRRCSCHRSSWCSAHRLTYDQPSHTQPWSAAQWSPPCIHVIAWITTQLPTPEGWKTELAWKRESPPAKDRRPNHWTTPPTSGEGSRGGVHVVGTGPGVWWRKSRSGLQGQFVHQKLKQSLKLVHNFNVFLYKI